MTTKTGTAGNLVFSVSPALTGTPDMSGATQLKLPVAASFATLANGEVGYDSTNSNWHFWQNGADVILAPLAAGFTSGHCGQPTSTGGVWQMADSGSACGSGGLSGLTTNGALYATSPTAATSITPPTVNGIYNLIYDVTASASVVPTAVLPGVPVDATNPATLLYSDRASYLNWTSGTALALPAATGNFASNMPFVLKNTAGSTLTITPNAGASNLIDGSATGTVLNNFASFIYQDGTPNWSTIKFPTFAAFGSTCTNGLTWSTTTGFACASSAPVGTVASGTSAMGTSPISSGTCATVVTTTATGTTTANKIVATPSTDPTGVTGYAPSASGSLYIQAYPTSNNVNFKVCNNTAGSITPAALTLNWTVI
jgi:hypothetical protein